KRRSIDACALLARGAPGGSIGLPARLLRAVLADLPRWHVDRGPTGLLVPPCGPDPPSDVPLHDRRDRFPGGRLVPLGRSAPHGPCGGPAPGWTPRRGPGGLGLAVRGHAAAPEQRAAHERAAPAVWQGGPCRGQTAVPDSQGPEGRSIS